MKNAWKSLKALLSDSSELLADENADKDAAKKVPGKKDESDDESDDDDDDDEEKDKVKNKDKKKADDADSETGENKAETTNMVHLALDDYNQLIALASMAKSATAENKKLKAKADEWDNYQAALSGTKPGADSAGAKADDTQDSKDPHAGLRTKYGSLMEDC